MDLRLSVEVDVMFVLTKVLVYVYDTTYMVMARTLRA